ncbi:hypothetical protein XAP412_420008 [Xanthomonas phaseoli pv. phaseoli]|uniref:Transposase n=1 Tax=Xanthomonas campestris pv. phaseoli TaxID=317013 RepID=A0AB38E1C7_XANCH|nr:hypothetical protein XAP6984_470008 [Xanthomonas phaseoli pv. phaseoli]SON85427.1 hypothetical protein XAP412_420008 [Xanthomonas phaseoli pv. phaseoli]SON90055.1 hypothetical protein XAP7430_440008 [Xanthomonas phaseoli pv. phaseoli]SOO27987.1 hypothetical protein XAP6164_2040016 [Xanthomonas phaseoli pv. phaseoli]
MGNREWGIMKAFPAYGPERLRRDPAPVSFRLNRFGDSRLLPDSPFSIPHSRP